MMKRAAKWLEEERQMVRDRVRYKKGNPMTAQQAITHLHFVKARIRYFSLYNDDYFKF
jgi:hypothetical protein